MAILSKSYPSYLGMVMSIVEIFAGLGGILAPTIGSVLFDNHGYKTPFYFSSGLQCFTLIG